MYNLHEFSEKPDSELREITAEAEPGSDTGKANSLPPVDFFNSAGNTKLEGDDTTTEANKEGEEVKRPSGRIVLGKVISGKATVTLINIFIPSFIVFSLSRFGYTSEKRQFKLTQEERDIMTPVVQDCLDYIVINFDNPFYALAFVSVMIYGSKAFDAIPELRKIRDDASEAIDENGSDTEEVKPQVKREYINVRKQIESTTIRKEKTRITIQAIEDGAPGNIIEAWKIYNGIFPERSEGYFRDFYSKNYEALPDSLKFGSNEEL